MDTAKKKVLVVEDDQMIREVYAEVLQEAGFLIDIAVNGEECVQKVNSFHPDIILLDIFLPKMSGFDVVEKFKADPELSKIPIIVLTNIYIDKEELIKKGVERCLIKAEVTPGEIVDKVKEVLNAPVTTA